MPLDRASSEATERCLYCPRLCRSACPVAHESASETLTPWGKMSLAALGVPAAAPLPRLPDRLDGLVRRALELVGAPRLPLDADAVEPFYACTNCLRCRVWCEHGNDVPHALLQARGEAADRGLAPAAARAVADRFQRQGHDQAADPAPVLERLAAENPVPPGGSAVLFAGCLAPLVRPQSVRAALEAARLLGAPLGLAREPVCCGRPLVDGGWRSEAREHLCYAWDRLGDREVVVLDAACAVALTVRARELGVEPRGPVVHVTAFLARRLGPDVQAPPLPGTATFHDPCALGRGMGEYDAPRRLLGAALAGGLVEAPSSREKADCCGAGGLLPRTYPEVARAMAMSRADELRGTGAGAVVTSCPGCLQALRGAGLDAADVVEIVAKWLQGGRAARVAGA
jgi:Fe-S oxidoreductase